MRFLILYILLILLFHYRRQPTVKKAQAYIKLYVSVYRLQYLTFCNIP
jgi:hypothetical protein